MSTAFASEWARIAGAILPTDPTDVGSDFSWLDAIDDDDCYMPLDPQRPSKSLDFGDDGHTGSVTTWHELLQLTAPHDDCGIVFVRGDFPDSAESVLARAQRRNQKGTFGLGIRVKDRAGDKPCVLEQTAAQGMINMRWPCTRLDFVRNVDGGGGAAAAFASYTVCSFVREHTLYQVARISPVLLSSAASIKAGAEPPVAVEVEIDVGGVIRFGCSRSARGSDGGPFSPQLDEYEEIKPQAGGPAYALACLSSRHDVKLEIRLWVDRKPMDLAKHQHDCPMDDRLVHASIGNEVCGLHAQYPCAVRDQPITLVASFSLVSKGRKTEFKPQTVISNAEVQEHLGVTESSHSAPYRLWSHLLHQAPGREAADLNAVGRCVETILGVLAVPIHHRDGSNSHDEHSPSNSSSSSIPVIQGRHGPSIALLRSIISPQVVDFESALWHVRLLSKALQFLEQYPVSKFRPMETDSHEDGLKKKHYHEMYSKYRDNLAKRLEGICLWMLNIVPFLQRSRSRDLQLGILASDVLPSDTTGMRGCNRQLSGGEPSLVVQEGRKRPNLPQQRIRMRSQKWYCALIIWYLLSDSHGHFEPEGMKNRLWDQLEVLGRFDNEDQRADTAILDDPYGCILRWYHSHAVWKICQTLAGEDGDRFSQLGIEVKRHKMLSNRWQIMAEKSLRLYGQGRLMRQLLGHDVANLAKLGPEIHVESRPIIRQGPGLTCLEYAKRLIEGRQPTKVLSAGRSIVIRWDTHHIRSAVPRPAPWELSCLGHHVPVNIDVAENPEEHLSACWQFLLSDYIFLGSLDQSKMTMVSQWWDLTTSSVVCATLLNELSDQRQASWKATAQLHNDSRRGMSVPVGEAEPAWRPRTLTREKSATNRLLPKSVQFHGHDLVDSTWHRTEESPHRGRGEGSKTCEPEGFEWTRRLPRLLYHADTFVQSLDDTPNLFRLKQTKNVGLRRNLRKYFREKLVRPPDWSLRKIQEVLYPQTLRHISCVDLSLGADSNSAPEILISLKKGRVECRDVLFWKTVDPAEGEEFLGLFKKHGDTSLLDLYFLGEQVKHPRFGKFPPRFQEMLRRESTRDRFLEAYGSSLFPVLNDSLVDLGTKYRIMFIKDFNPATLQALIYMWHPDALDTFDNHLGSLSTYSDITQQAPRGGEDVSITAITLSHWRLRNRRESEIYQIESKIEAHRFERVLKELEKNLRPAPDNEEQGSDDDDFDTESRTDAGVDDEETDFPPKVVLDKRSKEAKDDPRDQLSKIRSLSVSLVMTGDSRGRFWTCSVLSELIDETAAEGYSREVRDILQMFIHQQYAGRVLVFLLLLGYLCQHMSIECEKFVDQLDKITGMEPMVLFRGMPWQKSDVALKKLKQMLWGLEALRVFDDKLKRALSKIQAVRAKMKSQLQTEEEIRHKDMTRDAERVVEEFEMRYSRLENAHSNIQQRIEQGAKLREGITSVIGVEQNENISMLTWVTIAYLPLAFVAGVFSMGHGIIPDDAGWPTFGWLIVVFVLGTVVFALSLQFIIARLRHLEMRFLRTVSHGGQQPALAPMAPLSPIGGDIKAAWGRLRRRVTRQDEESRGG